MKKVLIFCVLAIILIILIGNVSYGFKGKKAYEIENLTYDKEEIYKIILEKNIDYKNQELLYVLCDWFTYFDREDMFLTQDGEFVDYVTYEIYRVHLENMYKNDKRKILKRLLRYNNYPKEENSEKYDEYINEYKKTTGKDI